MHSLEDALSVGRHVINEEARALTNLATSLGGDFLRCVETIFLSAGRIGVTGIGKSGYVARKVAATLNSTGTPAYFIHPSEASHGDLGSVGHNDVVLAFSNSGQSIELSDILAYAGRRGIALIAVTKDPDSFLGRQADIVVRLPDEPEAGPLGCAPTTSTTMMMALGDAVAMALLQLRGFTVEEFAHFHPGGNLGRKLMLVEDIMHKGEEVPLASPALPMGDALCLMSGKGLGCLVIVDEAGRLLGMVSDGDLRRHMDADLLRKTAGDIMTKDPVTIKANFVAAKALGLMNKRLITSIVVAEDDKRVQGLVHMHDCLRAGLD